MLSLQQAQTTKVKVVKVLLQARKQGMVGSNGGLRWLVITGQREVRGSGRRTAEQGTVRRASVPAGMAKGGMRLLVRPQPQRVHAAPPELWTHRLHGCARM